MILWFKKKLKYLTVIVILYIALYLVLKDKDGYGFGIIALVVWALLFLDLARLKIGDCEIDLLSKKDALSADERKLFLDNYNLVMNFIQQYMKEGYINNKALNYISDAFNEARLNLPDEIVEYTKEWAEKARKSFILHHNLEKLPVGEERSNLIDEEFKINMEIMGMIPANLYRKHIKINGNSIK